MTPDWNSFASIRIEGGGHCQMYQPAITDDTPRAIVNAGAGPRRNACGAMAASDEIHPAAEVPVASEEFPPWIALILPALLLRDIELWEEMAPDRNQGTYWSHEQRLRGIIW